MGDKGGGDGDPQYSPPENSPSPFPGTTERSLMLNAQEFLTDEQQSAAIQAIEGRYPPLHDYVVDTYSDGSATFTQLHHSGQSKRFLVVFRGNRVATMLPLRAM